MGLPGKKGHLTPWLRGDPRKETKESIGKLALPINEECELNFLSL